MKNKKRSQTLTKRRRKLIVHDEADTVITEEGFKFSKQMFDRTEHGKRDENGYPIIPGARAKGFRSDGTVVYEMVNK
jgi:hypothetical protein